MPYIKASKKKWLSLGKDIINAGDLNYMFTDIINRYIDAHSLNYQKINDIVGALEGAKMEFYRRIVIPYENEKIKENGDVY